jgi:O-methyltransferase involved in polyketide biosynthesis
VDEHIIFIVESVFMYLPPENSIKIINFIADTYQNGVLVVFDVINNGSYYNHFLKEYYMSQGFNIRGLNKKTNHDDYSKRFKHFKYFEFNYLFDYVKNTKLFKNIAKTKKDPVIYGYLRSTIFGSASNIDDIE